VDGPDLLPGRPGILDGSCCGVLVVPAGPGLLLAGPEVVPDPDVVAPEGSLTDGPDLLPGKPAVPGLETPSVLGACCWFDGACVLVCAYAVEAMAAKAAAVTMVERDFIVRSI